MITTRGIVIHPHELDEEWLHTLKCLNLNVVGLHPPGGKKADETLRQMLEQLETLQPLLQKVREMGIVVEYEMHALSYLLPRSLFEMHPDWFRMNEQGERTADFNFCASNADALEHLAQSAAELARRLPAENHLYYFWLDDVSSYSCHCEHCRQLSPSDQQMLAVNAIQRGIRTVDPLGCLPYLAYQDVICAPEKIKPDEGVFLEYAPIHRSTDHAMNDPDCAENVKELAGLERLLEVFGTKNAKVLDYWTDNSLFSKWKYPPKPFTLNAEVMRKDAQFYHSLGFESITAFGCFLGKDYIDLHGKPDLQAYGDILMNA